MKYITIEDRDYIEKKYSMHGNLATGLDNDEMQKALSALYEETKELDHAEAKAKGFAFVRKRLFLWFV